MKHFDLAFALLVSLALHAGLFILGGPYEEAQVVFEPGVSAVTLNIMPSVASRAATPEPPRPPAWAEPPPERPQPSVPEPEPIIQPEPEVVPPPEPPSEPTVEEPVEESVEEAPAEAPPKPVPATTAAEEPAPEPAPQESVPEAPREAVKKAPAEAASVDSVDANADLRPQGVTVQASAVDLRQLEYPFYSRRHGEEGTVVVEVEILASGRPGRIEVVASSGYRRLDRAAVRALREAEYRPARRAGVAVTTTKKFAFTFRLEGSEIR